MRWLEVVTSWPLKQNHNVQITHVTHNINRLNVKNHIIITRDVEKASASLKQLYDKVPLRK